MILKKKILSAFSITFFIVKVLPNTVSEGHVECVRAVATDLFPYWEFTGGLSCRQNSTEETWDEAHELTIWKLGEVYGDEHGWHNQMNIRNDVINTRHWIMKDGGNACAIILTVTKQLVTNNFHLCIVLMDTLRFLLTSIFLL